MTVSLVTGGSGFIGHHLVAALHARGQQVRVLDLRQPNDLPADVEFVHGSVLDGGAIEQALSGVERVYHLAGLPGMWAADKRDFHEVNCRGTELMLAAARRHGIDRFLHCSTESILFDYAGRGEAGADQPLLPAEWMPGAYTRSKALAEHHAKAAADAGFPVVIGTPTMPIGPADHHLTPPTAMLQHFLHKRVQLHLDFLVNLVDVRDVAMGLLLAMERGRIGERYILGGETVRLGRILRMMATTSGRHQLQISVPGKLAEFSAATLEFLADHLTHREPSGTAEGVRIARRASDLPIDKARRELGYAPRPIEPALRETIVHLLSADGQPRRATLERPALSSRTG